MKISISYLEKPASHDEVKISALFQRASNALAGGDFELFLSLYSDDSAVTMRINGSDVILNKSEFVRFLSKEASSIRNIAYKDARIRIYGPAGDKAELFCLCSIIKSGHPGPSLFYRRFAFVKQNEEWKIAGLDFVDF